MPRFTPLGWWCHSCGGTKNSPSDRVCSKCGASHHQRNAQVSQSERAVVYYNPATGEHRTPPRADLPMPGVYADQGFERREIMSMGAWERESGVVHEPTNFNPGNEPDPNREPTFPKPRPEVIHEIAKDIADAAASGPWTGQEKFG